MNRYSTIVNTFLEKSLVLTDKIPGLPFAILGGIAFGVIAKYFYDFAVKYFKAQNKRTVTWDWKGFWITVILSGFVGVMLYGFIFEKVSKLTDFWLVFSASGQAGFSSQSLIGEIGKEYR